VTGRVDANRERCLSPGTLMGLLDGELSDRERADALSHLASCECCRRLSAELSTMAKALEIHLSCLDDERTAAYADHEMGRMRGALTKPEIRRIRQHLSECERCREQVAMLKRTCKSAAGPSNLLGRLLPLSGVAWRPAAIRGLRLAVVAAVCAAGIAFLYLLGIGPRVRRPIAPAATHLAHRAAPPDSRLDSAVPPVGEQEVQHRPAPPAPSGATVSPAGTAPGAEPEQGVGDGRVSPHVPEPPQTAIVPDDQEAEAPISAALAELRRARGTGDLTGEARSATRLGGIYHKRRDYQSAAMYYRQAAEAAERAGEIELRVDALILLGGALAETGRNTGAREEFEVALGLARESGYVQGEENALVQLQLLEGD
jgi:anti-sigma factor RsiW